MHGLVIFHAQAFSLVCVGALRSPKPKPNDAIIIRQTRGLDCDGLDGSRSWSQICERGDLDNNNTTKKINPSSYSPFTFVRH